MPRQVSNIPRPHRRREKYSAVAAPKHHGATWQPVGRTATRLPQRPDRSILSEAIPLFFIGRNKDGFWVARDAEGSVGGIFLFKRSALLFAKRNTQPWGCASMLVSERFELDIENKGNPLVVRLGVARRLGLHLAQRLAACAGKLAAAGWMPIARFSTALVEQHVQRRRSRPHFTSTVTSTRPRTTTICR
jgi:hypothetical protein